MKFLSAMTAVSVGHTVGRQSYPGFFMRLAEQRPVLIKDGEVHIFQAVELVNVDGIVVEPTYCADAEDMEADDYVVIAPEQMVAAEVASVDPIVPVTSTLLPSEPAAGTDAQPENGSDGAAAALTAQGDTQEPVGLPASGAPSVDESAAAVEEVMQDAGAATPAGGVQEG